MSTVDELRQAATRLRDTFPNVCDCAGRLIETNAHEPSCSLYANEFPRAVADWLDFVVAVGEPGRSNGLTGEPYDFKQALRVARAFLAGAES